MTQNGTLKTFPLGNLDAYSVADEMSEDQPASGDARFNDHTSRDTTVRQPGTGLLDFKFINRIPIADVAQAIGYKIEGSHKNRQIVCPRSDEHKNKSQRYLIILGSNKVVCRSCDTYPLSVLDMVREFDGIEDLTVAAKCIAVYFTIPERPRGSHLRNPKWEQVPPGWTDPVVLMVVTGVWAGLSAPAQRLIPVFLAFERTRSEEEDGIPVSYGALQRYSSVESPNSIRAVLTELEAIGFLERLPLRTRGKSPVKATAWYRITPLSQRLIEFANKTAPQFGDEIVKEKAARQQKRLARERMFQGKR
jgi:hypothetical protein